MVLKLSKLPVSLLPFLKEVGRRDPNFTLLFSKITGIKITCFLALEIYWKSWTRNRKWGGAKALTGSVGVLAFGFSERIFLLGQGNTPVVNIININSFQLFQQHQCLPYNENQMNANQSYFSLIVLLRWYWGVIVLTSN